ncbi:MAG: heavy metal translocating P-type ATPase, partial [Pseudomonadales bacterium]|nr:heavy metal translocating P-type ATPase [Pseudomonadales bacterium]
LIVAVVTALMWYNFGPSPAHGYMLVTATTVLIIACPCALGLATPMSIIVSVGKAAQNGILIRNGDALQTAGKLDTVVLDKTGTITEGKPKVTDIVPWGETTETQLLQLIASVESASEHPLAIAIISKAKELNVPLIDCSDFSAQIGAGVKGKINSQTVYFGKATFLTENEVDTNPITSKAGELQAQGKTVMYAAINGEIAGLIAVADTIKGDSKQAIANMKQSGLKVIMLTGDNEQSARHIAELVGVDSFVANVLPADKKSNIQSLQNAGATVAMVGDGINDAPALAQADVGFAISRGSDIAIESADITLMRSSIGDVGNAIKISKATVSNIKQNLFGAFIYNSLGIPIAAGVLFPLTGALLNPMFAGAAMAMSSFTVVSNANRLRWVSLERSQQ